MDNQSFHVGFTDEQPGREPSQGSSRAVNGEPGASERHDGNLTGEPDGGRHHHHHHHHYKKHHGDHNHFNIPAHIYDRSVIH